MVRFRGGQTLLEGIIAIAVVAVGLMGVIGLAISNQASAQAIGDRSVATSLAREGLEAAKHIRDSNWLAGQPFSAGLLDVGPYAIPRFQVTSAGASWSLEGGSYDTFSPAETQVMWYEGADSPGHYVQQPDGGVPTKFRRRMELAPLCRPAGATGTSFTYTLESGSTCPAGTLVGVRVLSVVQWPQGPGLRTITLELRLFDWR